MACASCGGPETYLQVDGADLELPGCDDPVFLAWCAACRTLRGGAITARGEIAGHPHLHITDREFDAEELGLDPERGL